MARWHAVSDRTSALSRSDLGGFTKRRTMVTMPVTGVIWIPAMVIIVAAA
ncbi:MAG: hypothetical protein ABFC24_03900 [Methanoregulaceae archaeon]